MPLMPTSIISPNSIAPSGLVTIYDSVLQAAAANFDVQNIPGGYKNLFIVLTGATDKAAVNQETILMRFNNDSGGNYNNQRTQASQSTNTLAESIAATSFDSMGLFPAATSAAGSVATVEILISNYDSTSYYKPMTSQMATMFTTGATNTQLWESAGIWMSTSALTRITILPASSNFKAGTRLTIYGMGGTSQSLSQSYVGYNTIGGSSESLVSQKVLAKTLTVTTDYLLTSIHAYVKSDGVHVYGLNAALWADNAGAVGELLAASFGYPMNINTTPRWFSVPISYLLTAGTYWIGVKTADVSGYGVIYYDSGADMGWTEGGSWFSSGVNVSPADTTHKYSIRANVAR